MIVRTLLIILFIGLMVGYVVLQPERVLKPQPNPLTKITSQGEALNAWQGPWACVHDIRTGLLWEVKTDNESIHDGYWTYSWFDGDKGVPNWGDCYFEQDRCDVSDLIRRANQEQTCGVADWRLPTVAELSTLISNQARPGEPKIDKGFFPFTKKGDYWSVDGQKPLQGVFAHLKFGASAVNFGEGKVVTLPYRNAAFVRLVSASFSTNNL